MRAEDFAAHRQPFLTEVPGHPGVMALIPPPPPDPLPVESVVDALGEAERALGALEAAASRWSDPKGFIQLLAVREAARGGGRAVKPLTLLQFLEEAEGIRPVKTIAPSLAILTAWDVGRVAVETEGARALTVDLLAELGHWLVPEGPQGWREKPIWLAPDGSTPDQAGRAACPIDDARYVPPPPSYVPLCMMVLQRSLKGPESPSDPAGSLAMRAAIAHAQILGVHPLEDGNGRLARLLVALLGLSDGLPPLFIGVALRRRWGAYLDALTRLDREGDWSDYLRLFFAALTETAWETLRLGEALATLPATWAGPLAGARRHASSRKLAALLPYAPVMTVTGAKDRLGVSFPSANQALLDLESRGLVRELSGQKRGRIYAAMPVLDMLDHSLAQDFH